MQGFSSAIRDRYKQKWIKSLTGEGPRKKRKSMYRSHQKSYSKSEENVEGSQLWKNIKVDKLLAAIYRMFLSN